jgi:hypothetical protein
MNPFQSFPEYEEFVYTLQRHFPSVKSSTLIVIRRGKCTALLQGELLFAQGYRMVIRERLSYDIDAVVIESYGYEFWHDAEKISWYDSQPHPDDPLLASTYPHHKHLPPDMKHHRIPAPRLSFTVPNLPTLIQEIEQLIQTPSDISSS